MKSTRPKVLHTLNGESMVERVLRNARHVSPESVTLVVGHQAERVQQHLSARRDVRFVVQDPQLGTAHALLQTAGVLEGARGSVIVLSGDVPLLRGDTLLRLIAAHCGAGAAATVITATVEKPFGYGRIVRENGDIVRIVEERDATPEQRLIREINSGIYAFELSPLFDALRGIASRNDQGEYYLTDLVDIYRRQGRTVETVMIEDAREIRGVNSRAELAEVSRIVRLQKNEDLMASGVTLIDPAATYIDASVEIGPDTIIHPGVVLAGQTKIGSGCEVHSHVTLSGAQVADDVTINSFCVIASARIERGAVIGPFAHLRPDSVIGENAKVGNFVELKKTTLGPGSKANHLSYLGDATIGTGVNVGAGTITCNYDGQHKHPTVIEDGAFIGSDSQLIAPVRVGRGAYVAAGSSITADVPPGALGIARERQTVVEGWADKRRQASSGKD
jgi:bifunctional UDP-N-acetylglucosamine pyrophosphorylase/glucosamine-1-phosphate N-acetyltransferase